MADFFQRTEFLIGKKALEKLKNSKVLVFGVGGVGSYVCEALARSGIGHITVVDNDKVNESNINRQIIATTKTVGRLKVDVVKDRLTDINPDLTVETYAIFYLPDNSDIIDFKKYDYIVDAIDTVTAKINIILRAKVLNKPIISSMGTGNHLNPLDLEVTDISKTSVCPLAKVMRKELKDRNINDLKVVYSKETPIKPKEVMEITKVTDDKTIGRSTPGSIAFVPSVAGLVIASEVIKDLIKDIDI